MIQTNHAPTPRVAAVVFDAVAQMAEKHPAARMVIMHDPVANTTLIATVEGGHITYWNLLAPMSGEGTQFILEEQLECELTFELIRFNGTVGPNSAEAVSVSVI